MKRVALFLANGFEEIEAIATTDILRRAQIDVVTVSITEKRSVIGAHGVEVIADSIFEETDFSKIDLLLLPGGMPGSKHLNEHKGLKDLLIEFNSQHKLIAAICAAPMVLGGLGLLKGKRATCYPGFESELIGATIDGGNLIVDGNITTGKGPAFVFDFALSLVEQLVGLQVKEEVASGMLL